MTNDRVAGFALIAGTIGLIVTMAVHSTASGLFDPGRFDAAVRLIVGSHVLAIASVPLVFLGLLALSRRLSAGDGLAEGALIVFGLAALAVVVAGTMSGLVAPRVAEEVLDASPAAADTWRALFEYTGHLNQAFAQVFVVASAAAIALWSVSIVRSGRVARGIGVYGLVIAPLLVLGLAVGHLRLDVHGFGFVVVAEAAWYIATGVTLARGHARSVDPS